MTIINNESENTPAGVNIYTTEEKYGSPATVVEIGDTETTRLIARFGKDGDRYCSVISDKITNVSGDAVITKAGENVVSLSHGVPSAEEIHLKSVSAKQIRFIMILDKDAHGGYYELLDRVDNSQELCSHLDEMGINMSRTEEGVLTRQSDYHLVVGEGSEVYVNIGDRKYIRLEGAVSLTVSAGTVYIETTLDDKTYKVVLEIE